MGLDRQSGFIIAANSSQPARSSVSRNCTAFCHLSSASQKSRADRISDRNVLSNSLHCSHNVHWHPCYVTMCSWWYGRSPTCHNYGTVLNVRQRCLLVDQFHVASMATCDPINDSHSYMSLTCLLPGGHWFQKHRSNMLPSESLQQLNRHKCASKSKQQ